MTANNASETPKSRRWMLWLALLVILIPVIYSLVTSAAPVAAETGPFLQMPAPEHKECVRDTDYMRLHHWELLRQIREEVVRYGVRGDINLATCRGCHTNRDGFCNRCHDAVNMNPDCFGCHYYPSSADDPTHSSDEPETGQVGL